MVLRLVLVATLVVAVFFFYLYQVNTHRAVFYLTASRAYEAPLIVMLLISLGAGALLVILMSLIADLRKVIARWSLTRKERLQKRALELMAQGKEMLAEGHYLKARESFLAALEKEPALVPALLGGAEACRLLRDHGQSQTLLDRARRLGQNDLEQMLAVASGYQALGAVKEGIEACQALASLSDKSVRVYKKLSDLYSQAGMWREAGQAQKEVVRLSVNNGKFKEEEAILIGLQYQNAVELLTLGDQENAIKLLKEIIKEAEEFIPAHVILGDAYLKQGESQEAAEVWEKAYKYHRALVFLLRLEELYIAGGEPERAIKMYRRALAEKPGYLPLGLILGRLYLRLEMLDEALEHLTGLGGTSEESPFYHLLLGEVYRRRELHEKASDEFTRALGFRRKPALPFLCTACEREYPDWQGRCPNCQRWNSLSVKYEIKKEEI